MIWITWFMGADQLQVREKQIVSAFVDETSAAAGSKTIVFIRVKVKEGFHIQANSVNDASLIPATLRVTQNRSFDVGEPIFPSYKLFQLEGTDNYLNVFDSLFTIRLPIKIPAGTKAGRYIIKAQLHYQACDAKSCLFPRMLDLELPVVVSQNLFHQ